MADIMKRREWEARMARLIQSHVTLLRERCADGEISVDDHDRVGILVRDFIAHFISMSDEAWKIFVRIINESRELQRTPHEPDPRDTKEEVQKFYGGPMGDQLR